jgi:8-hydroxy-5-deazaflavin:NADPH oxidoreductase
MRFAVLGSGQVGRRIAGKLIELGHEVRLGSRSADNADTRQWAESAGPNASAGTFADAAAFGDIVVNCTAGVASVEVLRAVGTATLDGKLLIDVANPLQSDQGTTTLAVCNTDSLGEQIQRALPGVRVVKALNTMNNAVMVNPSLVDGSHNVFVCGNHDGAKGEVKALLESFGWPADDILDLGDITAARGTEMYLALWLRLWSVAPSPHFNIKLVG